MERAIDELPDAFRVVFVMRLVEEMSIEETASFLGLREETVRDSLAPGAPFASPGPRCAACACP